MAVGLTVDPIDVDFMPDWDKGSYDSAGGEITVSFFGNQVWSFKVEDGLVDEYDQEKIKDIAIEALGEVIAKALNERIQQSEWGGITVVRKD